MRIRNARVWLILLAGGSLGATTGDGNRGVDEPAGATVTARVTQGHAGLPLHFEKNAGQADARVQYISRGSGYTAFFTQTEAVLSLQRAQAEPPVVVRLKVVGGNPRPQVSGKDELPGRAHYLVGNDPSRWQTDVPTYARLSYRGVYPGVDLVYYGNQRQLEYDFVVSPGTDPAIIRMRFEGAEAVKGDGAGNLLLETSGGPLLQQAPIVYQEAEGKRTQIAGSYVLHGEGEVGFSLGRYDPGLPLVIDPVLAYSTYLGGSLDDNAHAIAVDPSGSAYVTGWTSSRDWPLASPYQATYQSGDAFVTKLSPSGTALVYSTYFGGNHLDWSYGIAVDSSGAAYVAGQTLSTDFPTVNAYQATKLAESDGFVAKLSPSGAALVYSTYLGGGEHEGVHAIAIDGSGAAYVTGYTYSTDFPTLNAYQATNQGESDGFVTKLSPAGSTLGYSTYLGHSGGDAPYGIAVDSSGSAYVTVGTLESPPESPEPAPDQGAGDAVCVTKLSPAGSTLDYSTCFGGSGTDYAYGIAVDSSGSAYVTGSACSADFPTVNPYQATNQGICDAFVTKLSPTGSNLVYSTYLGGEGNDFATGIAINSSGAAYVVGLTASTSFPTQHPFQATNRGSSDVFVTKLAPAGSCLVYSTYLGGSSDDIGRGIAVDGLGSAYVTGQSRSTDFRTRNAVQAANRGYLDAFLAKLLSRKGPLPPTPEEEPSCPPPGGERSGRE